MNFEDILNSYGLEIISDTFSPRFVDATKFNADFFISEIMNQTVFPVVDNNTDNTKSIIMLGEADYGKSTIVGYLYSKSIGVDMNIVEKRLRHKLGDLFHKGFIYSSLLEVVGNRQIKNNMRLNSTTRHYRKIKIDGVVGNSKLMMIDTPGHRSFIKEREKGMSMSDVGVFCIEINKIVSNEFDGSLFKRLDLWKRYSRDKKIIYILTKCDLAQYDESAYKLACRKIHEFNYILDMTIVAIVPVAVDFNKNEGINIDNYSDKTGWYKGLTLTNALKKYFNDTNHVRNEDYLSNPYNLLFSIDKEYYTPFNKTGKIWRIFIRSGTIKVDDTVKLTSVNIEGYPRNVYFDVEAKIKSIRDVINKTENIFNEKSHKGSFVTIDLRSCRINGDRLAKRDIRITAQSVGVSSSEYTDYVDALFIRVLENFKYIDAIKEGHQIILYWFGKRLYAKITKISTSNNGMYIHLQKRIAIPESIKLEHTGAAKRVILCTHHGEEQYYFTGFFELIDFVA